MINLFDSFSEIVRTLTPEELAHPERVNRLILDRGFVGRHDVKLVYAPFDHVNLSARIAIVGITPGRQQASNALKTAQSALNRGAGEAEASAEAKVCASFSGNMRPALIRLMDEIGLPRVLGIKSTQSLWGEHSHLVHFTSAIRYPVFVNCENWNGRAPNALRSDRMMTWLAEYTAAELRQLSDAIIVPLGGQVSAMLDYLAARGLLKPDQILSGLPHPSGSNSERIAYFLGRKPRELLSPKTDPVALDIARQTITTRVRAFR